jgi:hypothetical protein
MGAELIVLDSISNALKAELRRGRVLRALFAWVLQRESVRFAIVLQSRKGGYDWLGSKRGYGSFDYV